MSFGLGFLVGSLLLLAFVLYFTRIRNPAIPHAGTRSTDRGGSRTRTCELCEHERVCRTVNDLTVCPECEGDLMA